MPEFQWLTLPFRIDSRYSHGTVARFLSILRLHLLSRPFTSKLDKDHVHIHYSTPYYAPSNDAAIGVVALDKSDTCIRQTFCRHRFG